MLRIFTIVVIISLLVLVLGLLARQLLLSKSTEITVYKQPVPTNMQLPKNSPARAVPYALENVVDKDWHVKFDAFAPFFYWEPKNKLESTLVKYVTSDNIIKYDDIVVTKDQSTVETNPEEKYKEVLLSNTGKYAVLISKPFNPDIIYIKSFDTLETSQYTMTRNRPMNATLIKEGAWSPNDNYFYYMFYNEDGSETELWVINTNGKTNSKIYSSSNPIHIYGWKGNDTLVFHDRKIPDEKSITFKSINVSSGNVNVVGSCAEPLSYECNTSNFATLEDDVIHLDRSNQSGIYAYNFTNQLLKPLFEVGAGIGGVSSSINSLSPSGNYMYLTLHSRSGAINPKPGLYVVNVKNDSWRYLSDGKNMFVEMYDLNEFVSLIKSFPDDSYYIHETNGTLIEKVTVPANMKDFEKIIL